MAKNALIGFLLFLLLIAGALIVREHRSEKGDVLEAVEDVETAQNSLDREDESLINLKVTPQGENQVRIVGQWQKSDDSLSTLTFEADGVIIDTYGGGAISETGTYDYVSSESDLPEGAPYDPDSTYLRQTFGNQSYYYEIVLLDSRTLELLFLSEPSRTVKYTRVDS